MTNATKFKFSKHVAVLALATTAPLILFGCNDEEYMSEDEYQKAMDVWAAEDSKMIEGLKNNEFSNDF